MRPLPYRPSQPRDWCCVLRPSPGCHTQELEQQAIAAEARLIAFDRRNHLGVSEAVASKLEKAIVQVCRQRGLGRRKATVGHGRDCKGCELLAGAASGAYRCGRRAWPRNEVCSRGS